MAWEQQASYEFNLEEYEATKPAGRTKSECALPPSMRTEILRRSGYSRMEIVQLTKPVNIVRARRKATAQSLRLAGLQELMESLVRKTRNILTLGRLKRQERQYLERWCGSTSKNNVPQEAFPTAAFTEEDNSFGDAVETEA